MIDIKGIDNLEIFIIREEGNTLWVNDGEKCLLRISKIKRLIVTDNRIVKDIRRKIKQKRKEKAPEVFKGQCEYCFKMVKATELRTIQIRTGFFNYTEWSDNKNVCDDCRRYLRGQFKYL